MSLVMCGNLCLQDEVDGLSFEEQAELQKALYASLKEQKQSPKRNHPEADSLADRTDDDDDDQKQVSSPVKRPAPSPPPSASPTKRPRGRPRKHPKTSTSPESPRTQPVKKYSKKKVVIIDTPSEPTFCHTPPSITALQSPKQLRSILLPAPEPKPEPVPEPLPERIPEPVSDPIPPAVTEPLPKPVPEPIPETAPQPVPELIHRSVAQIHPEPVLEPTPKSTDVSTPKSPADPLPKSIPKTLSESTPEAKHAPTEVIAALASLPMAVVKPLHSSSSTPIPVAGNVPMEEGSSLALAEAGDRSLHPGSTEALQSPVSLGTTDGSQRHTGGEVSKLYLKSSKAPSVAWKSTESSKRRQPPSLIDMSTFFSSIPVQTTGVADKSGANKAARSESIKHPVIQTAKKSASIMSGGRKNLIPYRPDPSGERIRGSQTFPLSSSSPGSLVHMQTSMCTCTQMCEGSEKYGAVLEQKSCLPAEDGLVVTATGNAVKTNGIAVGREQGKGSAFSSGDDAQKSNSVARYMLSGIQHVPQ